MKFLQGIFKNFNTLKNIFRNEGVDFCTYIYGNTIHNNRVHSIQIKNQMILHTGLLAKPFSNYIKNILKIENEKPFKYYNLDISIYNYFLLNQFELEKVYTRLADDKSKDALNYILFLWITTPLFFDFGDNLCYSKELHYNDLQIINKYIKSTWNINDIKTESNIEEQYIIDKYKIQEGMYIIDGGAFTGDTAEIFSDKVGKTGKIFSFEPTKESFETLKCKNLNNVVCVPKGLYSETKTLRFNQNIYSPAANSISEDGDCAIEVTSIDEYVNLNGISHIDYIKMDIEGAELKALVGAKDTIAQFTPILAICIYHNLGKDCIDVPYYLISNYNNKYDFYIRQHSMAWGETMIYCVPKKEV